MDLVIPKVTGAIMAESAARRYAPAVFGLAVIIAGCEARRTDPPTVVPSAVTPESPIDQPTPTSQWAAPREIELFTSGGKRLVKSVPIGPTVGEELASKGLNPVAEVIRQVKADRGPTAPAAGADEAGTFTGRVDDLDFIANQGWCQVILRNGGEQLIVVTKEHRMQTLLEVAFATGRSAEVAYKRAEPNELTRVKLNRRAGASKFARSPARSCSRRMSSGNPPGYTTWEHGHGPRARPVDHPSFRLIGRPSARSHQEASPG